jgi:hypothetical protein
MSGAKFEFSDNASWKEYINDTVVPLKGSANRILEFEEEIKERFSGKLLIDLINDENIKSILLGGVKPDGTFSERSLRKYFSNTIGLNYDFQKYLAEVQSGSEPRNIPVKFEETVLTQFARFISLMCESIIVKLPTAGSISSTEVDADTWLKEPEKFVYAIKDFLEKCINFTAGYNAGTFFVWSMRKNTRNYINAISEKLSNEGEFKKLIETLGLEVLFEPDLGNPTLYTVWGYPEYNKYNKYGNYFSYYSGFGEFQKVISNSKTFGGKICLLNEQIWNHFKQDLPYIKMSVVEPPDPMKEYFQRVSGLTDETPVLDYKDTTYYFKSTSIQDYHQTGVRGTTPLSNPITLVDALDSMSQHQYLGIWEYSIRYTDNEKKEGLIEIERRE